MDISAFIFCQVPRVFSRFFSLARNERKGVALRHFPIQITRFVSAGRAFLIASGHQDAKIPEDKHIQYFSLGYICGPNFSVLG